MTLSQIIITFLLQSQKMGETEINKKYHNKVKGKDGYIPSTICGLNTIVGISTRGDIRPKVPYIALLSEGQTVKRGFYPVLLYYRDNNVLILSYGLSATNKPSTSWDFKRIGINTPVTIREYFNNYPHDEKYDTSYVGKVYNLGSLINDLKDIDTKDDALYKSQKINNIPLEDLFSFEKDIKEMAQQYLKQISTSNKTEAKNKHSKSNFDISVIINLISQTGLQYSSDLVKRFTFALMSKPFVILSGLAGSGKTQLALSFAKSLIQDSSQICVVAVGADWTNREPLLGYPNALARGEYILPDSKVLQLLIEANKQGNQEKPYFLILDEMNMSYVERYFADFLSAMESHESIQLWDAPAGQSVPSSLKLPANLFIIGTINVDETTYKFSPKVLDRANVIEFKISSQEMDSFLTNIRNVNINSVTGQAANMAALFVKTASSAKIVTNDKVKESLLKFFNELKSVNAEFGYRTATEIYRYVDIATEFNIKTLPRDLDFILDCTIVQKLLPKLHGSRKKLVPVLKKMWAICETGCELDDAVSVPTGSKYKLTADKILRMYRSAMDNGFTSFSEA